MSQQKRRWTPNTQANQLWDGVAWRCCHAGTRLDRAHGGSAGSPDQCRAGKLRQWSRLERCVPGDALPWLAMSTGSRLLKRSRLKKKPYKLDSHTLRSLVKYEQHGSTLQSQNDVPERIRRQTYAAEQEKAKQKLRMAGE